MIQKSKGTYDIYNGKAKEMEYLRKVMTSLMEKYNYKYFETPIFESSDLFHRSVGETTDIVSKETYDFVDRGGRNITLRPEGTAGIVRCLIENKLYTETKPIKAWYFGPMFRYERPQAGRYRQFYQFGIEAFGCDDPIMDAEAISIIVNFFKLLGLKGIKVNINTLGDIESRNNYRKALMDYFKPHLNNLCSDCQNRYEKNPLRILDCKVDANTDIMKNAPKMQDYLNEKSLKHYESVKKYLDEMDIEYIQNDNLVRGLDYYTHTVFEVEADIKGFGSNNVLGGGGRYDNLVKSLSGPELSGVGFAVGIERLLLALEYENINIIEKDNIEVYAFSLEKDLNTYLLALVNKIRLNGFNVEMDYMNRNLKNNFKHADKIEAKYILILGTDEVNNGIVTVKDNNTKEEYKLNQDNLIDFLDEKLGDK